MFTGIGIGVSPVFMGPRISGGGGLNISAITAIGLFYCPTIELTALLNSPNNSTTLLTAIALSF